MSIARIIEGRQHTIISCDAASTVEEAARLLAQHRIGAVPVLDGGRLAGIFSERDLLYCIASEGMQSLDRRVHEVMTAPAISIEPEADALDALSLMTRRRIRHLPVLRDGEMLGFVSIGDLVKYRIELAEAEAEKMLEYIRMA